MKIEIGKLSPGLIVSECIVRSLPDPCEGEPVSKSTRLQAQIRHQEGKRPSSLLCDMTYFSEVNEFLGHDHFDTQYQAEWGEDFLSLDMQLYIPEGATTAKLTISVRRGAGFWGVAGKITTVLCMLLLVVWIVRLTLQLIAAW